ncbi:hypothetical protein BC829DRAFT_449245 [Chytridium lagenaria]|nr:hypothetical protein BC829DRAFT_449245 [Chytridium lagenaria]
MRAAALSGLPQVPRKRFEVGGLIFVIIIFIVRLVRSGFIFQNTAQATPTPALTNNATYLQMATLLPTLFIRLVLDVWSFWNLHWSRVKYVEQAGREAFNIITSSLTIEFSLSILATIVACQEAVNTNPDRLAFMDWLLFSWCLASWVEQRPLFMLIFGSRLTTHSGGLDSSIKSPGDNEVAVTVVGASANHIASQQKTSSNSLQFPPSLTTDRVLHAKNMSNNTTIPTVVCAAAKAFQATSVYDRFNFGIMASGFSLALALKFGAALTTRKLRGTDSLAGVIMILWGIYISIQLVDMWHKRVYGVVITGFVWATSMSTILYSATLVSILHLSIMRAAALSGLSQVPRKRFEVGGLIFVIIIFIVRLVRSGFIFQNTAQATPTPALTNNATYLQMATLLPTLFIRLVLDVWSFWNLHWSRVKYVEQAGREAFNIITSSLAIEFGLSILATIVACQEAVNTNPDRLAFMDWLLFSWCLASWVEQRPLFMLIFGARLTTQTGSLETSSKSRGDAEVAVTVVGASANHIASQQKSMVQSQNGRK